MWIPNNACIASAAARLPKAGRHCSRCALRLASAELQVRRWLGYPEGQNTVGRRGCARGEDVPKPYTTPHSLRRCVSVHGAVLFTVTNEGGVLIPGRSPSPSHPPARPPARQSCTRHERTAKHCRNARRVLQSSEVELAQRRHLCSPHRFAAIMWSRVERRRYDTASRLLLRQGGQLQLPDYLAEQRDPSLPAQPRR